MLQKPTIDERMQRIHTRIQLERISGISAATEREEFLSFCERWEESGVVIHTPETRNGTICRAFDKWNDAPIFALRRKARVE